MAINIIYKMKDWIKINLEVNMAEAKIIKGMLESNSIPVKLKYDVAGQLYGITVGGLERVGILVPENYKKVAEALLEK